MKRLQKSHLISLKLLVLLLIASLALSFPFITAHASTSNSIINLIINDEVLITTNDYEVFGNQKSLTAHEFENIVQNGNNKVYLHYNTDKSIGTSYDALLCIKSNGTIHSYEFYEAENYDADFLVEAIK